MLSRLSCVQLFATLWAVAHQALLCMGFSRQEYWSGLPCPPPGDLSSPPPGDLSNPGIKPASLTSPAPAGRFFITKATWEAYVYGASLVAQLVKNLPVIQETWVQSLSREDPLEKEMATHSSILAWKIPWTEEPVQSMWSQRVGHD